MYLKRKRGIIIVFLEIVYTKTAGVPFSAIHDALKDIALKDINKVRLKDVFPICPSDRLGIACNYGCQTEYQTNSAIDGKGGYIRPLFIGVDDNDVYLFLIYQAHSINLTAIKVQPCQTYVPASSKLLTCLLCHPPENPRHLSGIH